MTRLSARSSLSSTAAARRCIFSMVASRASPSASRAMTTTSASAAANGKAEPEKAEAFAAREQILDQMRDAEPEAEQHQPADRGPEHRAPAPSARRGDDRRLDRNRQQRRVGFRRDVNRAARRGGWYRPGPSR